MSADKGTDLKQLAWETFQRDFLKLYEERPEQWVAYRGAEVLGYSAQRHVLFQELLARGFQREDFFIFCIVPHETELWFNPILDEL